MRLRLVAVALVIALAGVGCTGTAGTGDTTSGTQARAPITIGSKIDTEGSLLGQMIKLMLESKGYKTVDKTSLGPTDVNRKALLAGEIDVYPEYTGTALSTFFPAEKIDPAVLRNAGDAYSTAARLDKQKSDVVWLAAAPANNTWAIAIPQALADSGKIVTLEDFAKYVNGGGKVKLVGSSEFVQRPDALPSFEKAYGFKLKKDQLVILSGGNTAQTEKAAAQGTSGANAAMAYGTDGSLAALKLVVLKDPKGAQPIYQPAATFRGDVIAKYPDIPSFLDPVFLSLDEAALQKLNASIAIEGKSPAEVAKAYLTEKGFLK